MAGPDRSTVWVSEVIGIGCLINRFPGYRLQDGCFDLHNSALRWVPRVGPAGLPRYGQVPSTPGGLGYLAAD
jgi:hypothetical protein